MRARPTDKTDARQCWATPEWFVRGVERMTGRPFDVDVAAKAWSAKAPTHLGPDSTVAENAFDVCWPDFWETAWCNPPFGAIDPWVDRAIEHAAASSFEGPPFVTFLLVPDRTDRPWWHRLVQHRRAFVTFIEGRVAFEPPPGVKPSSPGGGVVLWQVGGTMPALEPSITLAQVREMGRQAA